MKPRDTATAWGNGDSQRVGTPEAQQPGCAPSAAQAIPSRVRRGNQEDHRRLQAAIVAAALELFRQGGTDAVTMQALARSLGRSAMSLYRYFDGKNAVLQELWRVAFGELLLVLQACVDARSSAQQRHRSLVEGFVDFWEQRPDYYRLVYLTSSPSGQPGQVQPQALMPVYGDILALFARITRALADELGSGHERLALADELRLALALGYLQARFANPRYPWGDFARLREACVEAIVGGVARCLAPDAPRAA